MADTPKRAYGPAQPGTGAGTAYTVPGATTFILLNVVAANTTSSDATLTLSIGTDAAATRLLDTVTIPARQTETFSCWTPMAAAEIIQLKQGTSSAITVTISGIEVT